MLVDKRRWLYMLALLGVVLAGEISITGGMSVNAQVVLVACTLGYLGADAHVKAKKVTNGKA